MNEMINYYGKELFEQVPLKLTGTLLFMGLARQALLFLCFASLVTVDLISRWLAISADLLRAEGHPSPSLMAMAKAIPRARRLGLIRSSIMKEQGLSKLLLYGLCVFASGMADWALASAGEPSGMSAIAVSYLSATEALSVIENLSEAGVESMGRLLTRLKGGRGK